MTWKKAFSRAMEKEMQPMKQATYWIVFVSFALSVTCLAVSGASAASMDVIDIHPEIADSSWLTS